jgi:hypothetical protein
VSWRSYRKSGATEKELQPQNLLLKHKQLLIEKMYQVVLPASREFSSKALFLTA